MSELVTVGQAFQQGLTEEMERDDTVFVLGTDLFIRGGHFAQVKGIGPQFGAERVIDAPISEAAMVAAGVGAAMNGMRPIIDLNFIDFAFGAMDEIANQAAKARYLWGGPSRWSSAPPPACRCSRPNTTTASRRGLCTCRGSRS
jgi:acetoin:2,6-dichlorophenolindophenol oxidoreductase subunit beta